MSDLSERKVSGPPPRTRKPEQGRSRLVKANRDAAQAAGQQATPDGGAALEVPDVSGLVSDIAPTPLPADETASTAPAALSGTTTSTPAAAVDTARVDDEPKKLVNATYRVPADLKQRLNSAISAVKVFEGWTSAEEYVQDLFEREIKRIQDDYNNGEPFPLRTRAMPRGRSIPPKGQ